MLLRTTWLLYHCFSNDYDWDNQSRQKTNQKCFKATFRFLFVSIRNVVLHHFFNSFFTLNLVSLEKQWWYNKKSNLDTKKSCNIATNHDCTIKKCLNRIINFSWLTEKISGHKSQMMKLLLQRMYCRRSIRRTNNLCTLHNWQICRITGRDHRSRR